MSLARTSLLKTVSSSQGLSSVGLVASIEYRFSHSVETVVHEIYFERVPLADLRKWEGEPQPPYT
jgi:hypothetical protein